MTQYVNKDVMLDGTRFIFQRNFAGDPSKSGKYASTARVANILIPDELAGEMLADGWDIRETKPREGEEEDFIPQHYLKIEVKYRDKFNQPLRFLPNVYLVTDGEEPTPLNEDSIKVLDDIRVRAVNVVLHPSVKEDGSYKAYVKVMYVEQNLDDDPFASRYVRA